MRRIVLRRNGGFLAAIALLLVGMAAPSADAIELDFSSVFGGSSVDFTSGGGIASFSFVDEVPGSFNDFFITNSSGVGDSIGLNGDIDGVFSYSSASILFPGAGLQVAPVVGGGTLAIDDGAGFVLTATLFWTEVATLADIGGTNITGAINLFGFSYGGVNSDLSALAGLGTITTTFQSTDGYDLLTMATDPVGTVNSYGSYSGSIVTPPVPEPATLSLLGLGLVGMAIRRKRISV